MTPLASIFGSGFLIIVPVLERTLGALAVLSARSLVCALAYADRDRDPPHHQRRRAAIAAGHSAADACRLDRLGDVVIVVAYVISVALYLRIMAQYVVDYVAGAGSATSPSARSPPAALRVIVAVGVMRGFSGLERIERISLVGGARADHGARRALLFADAGDLLDAGPRAAAGSGHRARRARCWCSAGS